jgi:hypothetical protein
MDLLRAFNDTVAVPILVVGATMVGANQQAAAVVTTPLRKAHELSGWQVRSLQGLMGGSVGQPIVVSGSRGTFAMTTQPLNDDSYGSQTAFATDTVEVIAPLQETEIVRADSDRTASFTWLAQALDTIGQPTGHESVAVTFDPDDYPIH